VSRPPRPRDPSEPKKPAPKPWVLTLEKLPAQCREVITAGNPPEVKLPPIIAKAPAVTPASTGAANDDTLTPPTKSEKSSRYQKPWKAKTVKYAQAKTKFARPYSLGAKTKFAPPSYVGAKTKFVPPAYLGAGSNLRNRRGTVSRRALTPVRYYKKTATR
jgi:hypothetical protein